MNTQQSRTLSRNEKGQFLKTQQQYHGQGYISTMDKATRPYRPETIPSDTQLRAAGAHAEVAAAYFRSKRKDGGIKHVKAIDLIFANDFKAYIGHCSLHRINPFSWTEVDEDFSSRFENAALVDVGPTPEEDIFREAY